MAIGDTVQAGLGRMDFSAFQRAGEAQARVGERMGQTVGGIIDQYQLNKERQKKNEGLIKSQSSMLDMLAEQDPEMAPRYAAMKAELNNPDIALSTRAELGKNLAKNISLSSQLKGQRLLQETQAQTLKERQDTENLRQNLLKQQSDLNEILYDLKSLNLKELKQLSPIKTKETITRLQSSIERLPSETKAAISSNIAKEIQGDVEFADVMRQGGPMGVARNRQELRDLNQENIKSLIRSRDIYSAASLYKSMNIGGTVTQDVEKRFSDIASQIKQIDDSQVKVRDTDGDEVMISFKDYQENPDNYAPQISDRIKLLQAKKEGLIEEQSNVMLDAKIPYTDPETGQKLFTTVREKMEYDQLRAKRLEEERQAQIEENKAKLPGAFGGIPTVPVMNY